MAKVLSVNISEIKGTVKKPVESIKLQINHGIEGDAHAGDWHRQVSLLADESINKMREKLPDVTLVPGVFAENITTQGLELHTLPIGTKLKIGTALVEVTQIGKECHLGCEIRNLTGDCIMPREGIFTAVLEEGTVRAGDEIAPVSANA